MVNKKILIEKLKDRVLSSLNESSRTKDGPEFSEPFIGNHKDKTTVNLYYDPTKNTKPKSGEEWFYKPFNSCLKNLMLKHPNDVNFDLNGYTFCYQKKTSNDKGCFEARYSQDDKGNWHATPGRISNPHLLDLNTFNMSGDWWCEPGKTEPIVDWLPRTKAHRERMFNKDKWRPESEEEYQRFVKQELEKQELKKRSLRNITQAKTMEDVKNGVGYIIKGMRGPVVKELQKMLLKWNKDILGPSKDDSIFGEDTESAVEKFQKDSNIKPKNDIYGIFGKITYEKMMKKLNDLK